MIFFGDHATGLYCPRSMSPPTQSFWSRLTEQVRVAVHLTRGDYDPRAEVSRLQRLLATYLRVIFLVFRLDVYRRVELQAQALTMQSLLAVVPTLAVCFALFKS